jgi:hypothetical protein
MFSALQLQSHDGPHPHSFFPGVLAARPMLVDRIAAGLAPALGWW